MMRARITIEVGLDETYLKRVNLPVEKVPSCITLGKSDVIDTLGAVTFLPDATMPTNGMFLPETVQVFTEIVDGQRKNDGLDDIRERVRDDIRTNGETCYGMTPAEVEAICCEENDVVETLTSEAHHIMVDADKTMDDAVDRAAEKIKALLEAYRTEKREEV